MDPTSPSTANPYQSPPEIDAEGNVDSRDRATSIAIEFESDWSPAGLRLRRRSASQRLADSVLVLFVFFWVGAAAFDFFGRSTGLLCIATPLTIMYTILWMANLTFRSGAAFPKKCRGLAGPVTGSIASGWVAIDGPSLRVVAPMRACVQCFVRADEALVRPPGIDETLPIIQPDIKRTWQAEQQSNFADIEPMDLLRQMSTDDQHVIVSGTLRGSDFRGQNCYQSWLIVGAICITLGLLVLVWDAYRVANLPHWVLNKPSHYELTQDERGAVASAWFIGGVALVLIATGLWSLSRTFRKVGAFAAMITPAMIAIASTRVAFGYHGSAVEHFQCNENGIVVRNAANQVVFIIPARWFGRGEIETAATWYSRTAHPPEKGFYIGPRV